MSELEELRGKLQDRHNQTIVSWILSFLGMSPYKHGIIRKYLALRYGLDHIYIWEDYDNIYRYDKKSKRGGNACPCRSFGQRKGRSC